MYNDTIEPRVWLGCLACYNSGHLVGEWMSPEDAADAEPRAIHHGEDAVRMVRDQREGYGAHDEVWVMDHEHTGREGEFGPIECQAIADAFETIGETQWSAFLAYCRTGMGWMDGDGQTDPSSFEESYAGEWDSWREYADETAEEMIACHGPRGDDDLMTRYFDYEMFARDLAFDYVTEDAPGGGVYVFRSV